GELLVDEAMMAQPDRLALDEQHHAREFGSAPRGLVLAQPRGAPLGIALGVERQPQGPGFLERGVQALPRAPQRGGLLLDDLLFELLEPLAPLHAVIRGSATPPASAGAPGTARRCRPCGDRHCRAG